MAKKISPKTTVVAVSPVRNTAIPKVTPAGQPARKEVTHDMIAQRAYEIWQTSGGSEMDNWLRAERELRTA
jgi:hypothetical protein